MKEQAADENQSCLGTTGSDIGRYLAKAARHRTPLAVSLELTRRCNFRCVHCYLGRQESIRQHRQREMDTPAVIRLLDEMAGSGTLFLTLTGGDPMLRPDFLQIYRHAVCNGLLTTVFCNGSLVTEEIVQALAAHPPRIVEVTVYGATQKTFEAMTQQKGSFAACMAGIERLRQGKVRLRLKTMVTTLNCNELADIRKLVEDMGLQFRHDCSVIPALPNDDNDGATNAGSSLQDTLRFRLAPEQAAEADLSFANVQERMQEVLLRRLAPSTLLYRCGAGRASCHVTPYGKMQPCLITSWAAIDATRFQEGWTSICRQFPEQEARQNFPCSSCGEIAICRGCPSSFFLETGDPQQNASFYCRYAACHRTGLLQRETAAS